MTESLKILVVDDDEVARFAARRLLGKALPEAEVLEAEAVEGALRILSENACDCALVDYRLQGPTGLDLVRAIRRTETAHQVPGGMPILMLTGAGDESTAVQAMKEGVTDYIPKSELSVDRLSSAVRSSLEIHKNKADATRARRELERANQDLEAKVIERTEALSHAVEELKTEVAQRRRVVVELRRAQSQLRRQNKHLLQLNQVARDFVDQVSHDFRTPLTVIRESASILFDGLLGALTDEQKEYLAMLIDRASDLGVMVDDLLDMSRLEAGILPMHQGFVAIEDILHRVRPTLEMKARATKAALEINAGAGLPPIFCDAEKIGRVLVNLTTNALHCGPEGRHVEVWARRDANSRLVTIGITDDGPGISAENLKTLFQRFQQVQGSWSKEKGFGLGLHIVRELVRMNLGEVSVDSELGRGSTFSFTLPCGAPHDVLQHYIKQLPPPPSGPAAISLLTISSEEISASRSADDVEMFLQYVLRVGDLLLRVSPSTWLLAAVCDEAGASQLTSRFQKARCEFAKGSPKGELPVLELQRRVTWRPGEDVGPLFQLMDELSPMTDLVHA